MVWNRVAQGREAIMLAAWCRGRSRWASPDLILHCSTGSGDRDLEGPEDDEYDGKRPQKELAAAGLTAPLQDK